MDDIYFVTSNEGKLMEFKRMIGSEIKRVDIDLPEIQAIEVEDVAREKAIFAYEKLKKPVFIEDSGLYFKELNYLPGALIRSFLERLSLEEICILIRNDRGAIAKTCLAYTLDGKNISFFKGEINGSIAESPIGENGFGWDPIFIPFGRDKTFAQMTNDEKNDISMRRIACNEFKKYLDEHYQFGE
ncbi:MAG: RdgB/HAM1 family non-canonical purine NTP pyrophosphatase [Candidatus Pacebacteria bacterium]|nr:RdgB/HAM1 family non-canonical purine NTP pyrophosphatase [Candidatus Paceibacterota bacterium]